ncbi:MAG: AMP-binding protein [Planctomycetaceae bacterium]|nr:AMP-binding protein [Planctomycetaceae bacterium]
MATQLLTWSAQTEDVSIGSPYPSGVPRCLSYPEIPAWGLLDRAASLMPGRIGCIYNDVEWTWEELNFQAARTATSLRELGVSAGDRVGVLLPNIPEYIIALNGIWRAGGIAVALSPMAVPEEIDRLLESTSCRVVICLDMLSGLVSGPHRPEKTLLVSLRPQLPLVEQVGYLYLRKRRTGHWVMPSNDGHTEWFWDVIGNADSRSTGVAVAESVANDENTNWSLVPAYILPTGGTTGEPKAVALSHRNMVANAWQQYYWAGASIGKETLLSVLPFFHSYGLSTNVMGGAAMAATLIMHHRFNTRQVIQLIERYRPTVFHAVPAMLVAMNEQLRSRPADLSSLKWIISGGASLPESVGREFAEHCNRMRSSPDGNGVTETLVVEGYGLSEASPVTHVGPLTSAARFGTIGLPLPDTNCRIADISAEGGVRDVDAGGIGELLVNGPQVMLGYWHEIRPLLVNGTLSKPAESTAIQNGWLATGDMARRTPEGLYQIVDRKKDMIITSGFNVYPQEVEHALKTHPDVKDAAVIGVPDEHRGEAVKAFIVLKSGAAWNEGALAAHCKEHLSAHKRPRIYEHCKGDLPRSFLGKVIRRKLKD